MEMHSRKTQTYRTRAAETFRRETRTIMFSSDVSARGVDYPDVTLVVQVIIHHSNTSLGLNSGSAMCVRRHDHVLLAHHLSELQDRIIVAPHMLRSIHACT